MTFDTNSEIGMYRIFFGPSRIFYFQWEGELCQKYFETLFLLSLAPHKLLSKKTSIEIMLQLDLNIDKIRGGDEEAFKSFFITFYPKLKALACRFVDEQVADDLVQDVFASYWEQKTSIQADNIQSFLFKCLQNKCLNLIKHQMVEEEYESRVRIAEARIAYLADTSDANLVLEQVMNRDLREIIEKSVEKLPPKCAQAFRLCYFHDVDRKEVAELMGISPRTVDGHIQQALNFLREDLKDLFLLVFMFYSTF